MQGRRSKAKQSTVSPEHDKIYLFLTSVSSVIYQINKIVLDLSGPGQCLWKHSMQAEQRKIWLMEELGRTLTARCKLFSLYL